LSAKLHLYILLSFLLIGTFGCKSTQEKKTDSTDKPWTTSHRTAGQINSTSSLLEAKRQLINGEVDLAIKNLDLAISKNPKNDAAYFEMSRIYQMIGGDSKDKSLKFAEKASELDPDNIWYHRNIIAIYKQQKKYDLAAKEAALLVKKYPDEKGNYYQLANMYIHDNNLKAALKTYQEIQNHFGYEEGVSLQIKQIYLKMGEYNKALKELDILIEHNPETKKFYGMAADIYLSQKEYEKAYENYEKILSIDPKDGRVHLAISDYYKMKGQQQKAYQEILLAFSSPELDIDTKMKVLLKYFQNSEQDSLSKLHTYELLDTLVAVHPNEPKALAIKADFLNQQGQYKEALDYFHRVIVLDSSRYLVWEQMLLVELRLEKYPEMVTESERALRLFPQQPSLYYFNGLANLKTKNYLQAEKHLKMGLNFVFDEKTKSSFYGLMAQSEFKQHKFGPAEDHFAMAVKLNPLNAEALKDYAYYLAYHNKEIEAAKEMASRALEIEPKDVDYIYTYAFVLFKAGEIAQAKKWIKDGLNKYPQNKKLQLLDQEVNKDE